MSSNRAFTSYSSTSYSSSSSSSSGGQPHTQSYTETTTYDSEHGGHTYRRHEETGKDPVEERTEIPASGRQISGRADDEVRDTSRRIEDVTDQAEKDQAERDRQYLERMEEEYAKREGGA